TFANFLFSPVLRNFPGLKVVWSEAGIGWIPAFLHRCDRTVARHANWSVQSDVLPSELFARDMWCCLVEEPGSLQQWRENGVDKIVVETDYPHADSTFPRVQEAFAEVFDGLPDDVVEAVSHGNAEQLFNWQMADERETQRPDVVDWRETLRKDPYAAMARYREFDRIPRVRTGNESTCIHPIRGRGGEFAPCGLPLGDDGRCEAGHRPLAASAVQA